MHETTLTYDEALVRRGVRCYWRRSLGPAYFAALVVVVASLGALLALGGGSWVVPVLGGTLVLALGFAAMLYAVHLRAALGRFRRMDAPLARFVADDERFAFSSTVGDASLKWSVVKELWRFDDLWLLLYREGGFNVLPLACLPPPMRDFLVRRVEAAGGRVR